MTRVLTMPFEAGQDLDKAYFERLLNLGFHEDEANEIVAEACAEYDWCNAGGDEHLGKYIANLYCTSWLSVEEAKAPFLCRNGSVAGTPLADLIFTCSVAKVFKGVREDFALLDLTVDIDLDRLANVLGIRCPDDSKPPTRFVHDISFADDDMFPVFAPACDIAVKTSSACAVIVNRFSRFGLIVNYARGKTEIIIYFIGTGAHNARAALWTGTFAVITSVNDRGAKKEVRIVEKYKHVGTTTAANSSLMPELVTRLASMFTSFKPIRSKILCNYDIPVDSRLNIVRGFLLAKGMFQFSTFRELNVTEAKKIHTSVMSIYRAMLGADKPHVEHVNDNDIISKLKVLAPLGMLSYMRVHLFVRMIVRPPVQLWHLLVNVFSTSRS